MKVAQTSGAQQHLLIVEDDAVLCKRLTTGLSQQGYVVFSARNLVAAQRHLEQQNIELVLLDVGLPDGSGFDFISRLQLEFPGLPVIFLTARSSIADKVKGLDLGAQDYLIKPFDFHELLARIRARLRGRNGGDAMILEVADLRIDLGRREVYRGSRMIDCTPKEFDVLVCLAQSMGMPVSRAVLAGEVWKVRARMTSLDNVIDVMFSRLREKVDGAGGKRLIHTVRGRGYMLKEPACD
jgi:two-component system copper resistance phosphate regulon response regulator CusR